MAFDPTIRKNARRLYIFEHLPVDTIARRVGVSGNTIWRWKAESLEKGDDWDKYRAANIVASNDPADIAQSLINGFVVLFDSVQKDILTAELSPLEKAKTLAGLSDSFNKVSIAARRALPETDELGVALKVMDLLGEYIQEKKPDLLHEFSLILEDFGRILPKKLNRK